MQDPPPPIPPPKAGSHEASRMSTPGAPTSPSPLSMSRKLSGNGENYGTSRTNPFEGTGRSATADPGEHWLPQTLQDKSKQDIADILASPDLLNALTHSPVTAHPSLTESRQSTQTALVENLDLASRLLELESRLAHQRATTQAQLLSTHALERQWRQKQTDMDTALSPFSPASLYQKLNQGVHEQSSICHVMEESFLDGEGDGAFASEREVADWVRRYKDARSLYYLRQERKGRWDEGRVGGWR